MTNNTTESLATLENDLRLMLAVAGKVAAAYVKHPYEQRRAPESQAAHVVGLVGASLREGNAELIREIFNNVVRALAKREQAQELARRKRPVRMTAKMKPTKRRHARKATGTCGA